MAYGKSPLSNICHMLNYKIQNDNELFASIDLVQIMLHLHYKR